MSNPHAAVGVRPAPQAHLRHTDVRTVAHKHGSNTAASSSRPAAFSYVPRSATGVAGAATSVTIRVSKHDAGDGDDHDRKRNGHRGGDVCEHDEDRRGEDDNDNANDNYRER